MTESLPEFTLDLRPASEEAKQAQGFRWADEVVGKRSKIGGKPDFLQDEEIPLCNDCGKKMTFYSQLDSVGDHICIADCGMIYVFICFDCYKTTSFVQSG